MLCSKKIQLDVIYLQSIHVLDTPWNQIAVGLETLDSLLLNEKVNSSMVIFLRHVRVQ